MVDLLGEIERLDPSPIPYLAGSRCDSVLESSQHDVLYELPRHGSPMNEGSEITTLTQGNQRPAAPELMPEPRDKCSHPPLRNEWPFLLPCCNATSR